MLCLVVASCLLFLGAVAAPITPTRVVEEPVELAAARSPIVESPRVKEFVEVDLIERYRGEIPRDYVEIVIHTESDGIHSAHALPKGCDARGLMQITQPCLTQFNWYTGNEYTMDDMWDAGKNVQVGCWYLNYAMRYMRREFGSHYTVEDFWYRLYVFYNAGPDRAINYYTKFYSKGRKKDGSKYPDLDRFKKIEAKWYDGELGEVCVITKELVYR